MNKVVEMKGITKVFPGTIANDNIDFDLLSGETHVLLGENGAGKTTLMNILYGLYQPEKGEIYIKGNKVKITNPNDAIKLGIGMVHQHFMLVHNFTIAENIILGKETKKGITLDIEKAKEDVKKLAERYGFNINPEDVIEDITVGQQQKVEILKALYRGAEILILDEPTAVLTPAEIDELGVIIDNLKAEGKSVILITHKLKEVMKMSDRVTIIRRGKAMGVVDTKDTSIDELAELMVGRKVKLVVDKKEASPGDIILSIKNLYAKDSRKLPALKGVDLDVRAGEIVGIAGVDGNGQKELIEVLTGLRKGESGIININSINVMGKSTKEIMDLGVGHIPEDRQQRGLILPYTLYENSILGIHHRAPFAKNILMNYRKIREHAKKLIKEFDVRTPSDSVSAAALSGGNQQKLIVAREISKNPNLLIAAQPTRGVDVGAIEFIHKRLVGERDNGKAVLLVSFELDEILALADRIAVMYDGEIVGVLDRKDADEQKIGVLMAGGSLENSEIEVKDIEECKEKQHI
ncbi:ABC transporter ATP-binding protein [Clostridium sp. K25]|uniref:Ribose import ATP-binding protein RbsA 1 n=1 Tax=Clostridium botulinum D str. 1873 TaxID=592027 RepID=A0A9P2G763_CLOBO|nr:MULTISPECIES: ABC transporter ATP-binding protein [Clostridium]AYF53521.1 ABC transporter ATP-binding protein [Clostridium novyi]EES91176.1 ribose import ATP-binding protein RbsA 1 [Clostridium botulinum D str. 1873]KEI07640.1 ABC transporter ATP-binding protein [Clostridium sp. K25]MBO3440874.1 ABC transporter ATP-binding protein [Clostridium haemolyticum]MCD3216378.1 ABC transporter ATP-binding protein [Clostridium botulinum C]